MGTGWDGMGLTQTEALRLCLMNEISKYRSSLSLFLLRMGFGFVSLSLSCSPIAPVRRLSACLSPRGNCVRLRNAEAAAAVATT